MLLLAMLVLVAPPRKSHRRLISARFRHFLCIFYDVYRLRMNLCINSKTCCSLNVHFIECAVEIDLHADLHLSQCSFQH